MIVPPSWFCPCGDELTALTGAAVSVMCTQMRFAGGFGYSFDEIRAAVGEVEACALSLAAADVELVAQVGTPFSTVRGWQDGCALEQRLCAAAGLPVEMMGLAVPRAFLGLGLRSATVCTVYYEPDWTRAYVAFLEAAGIRVLHAGSFAEHGLVQGASALAACHQQFPAQVLLRSVERACELAPAADGVIVAGIPCPQLALIEQLEAVAGRPVVSYPALYARVLDALRLSPVLAAGRLLRPPDH